ncbi:hypothetical protein IPM19_01545 [bacterium]|nr:MAG: hypothetical protein IPM19_01545 [bacterium]
MLKTSAIPFIGPSVASKTKTSSSKAAPVAWSVTRAKSKPNFRIGAKLSANFVPALSVTLMAAVVGMLALHLFWVNTYSSKGFELERAQTAIEEQTEIQKKLLVKQSLMSSTVSLSDLSKTGLVPVTESETLNGNTFAQAK